MAHLGYLGISWDSLRLQLSHCDPPQPRDRRGGRHIFAKSRFCGLAKPEATATLHTTHRPGAQSDVFWRSSEIPMIYWYTFKIPSKYLQKSSKSNIIQYPTFSDTPKWSKGDWLQDFDGSGLDRLTSGLVLLVRSPSGFYEWARKPSESHIAKAKTKEAARRASTSQLFSFDVFGSLCQGLPSSFVDLWCWGWRLVCCEPDPEDLPGSSQRLLQEALGSRLRQSASGHLSNCWERDIMRFAEFFFGSGIFCNNDRCLFWVPDLHQVISQESHDSTGDCGLRAISAASTARQGSFGEGTRRCNLRSVVSNMFQGLWNPWWSWFTVWDDHLRNIIKLQLAIHGYTWLYMAIHGLYSILSILC